MARKEPSDAAMFAARLARAYPSLSAYSAASLAHELCSIERAQRRHAERCCNGEDGGYVRRGVRGGRDYHFAPGAKMATPMLVHDPVAEERAGKRIERRVLAWRRSVATYGMPDGMPFVLGAVTVSLHSDPRGRVLLVRLPGEADAS